MFYAQGKKKPIIFNRIFLLIKKKILITVSIKTYILLSFIIFISIIKFKI